MGKTAFTRLLVWKLIVLGLSAIAAVTPAVAAPSFVRLVKDESGHRLHRYGQAILHQGGRR